MATRTPILNYQPGGGVPPGVSTPPTRQGPLFYWPQIINLTGGNPATDLDAQDISVLPPDSLITVVIDGRGESQWLRVQQGGSPVTDTNAGLIVPTNYDSLLRPYVLKRQIGF